MKVLLGVILILLVVLGSAAGVYAYTKHREVSYLTLRADHLERRINELESGPSTEDNPEEANRVRHEELGREGPTVEEIEAANRAYRQGLENTAAPSVGGIREGCVNTRRLVQTMPGWLRASVVEILVEQPQNRHLNLMDCFTLQEHLDFRESRLSNEMGMRQNQRAGY